MMNLTFATNPARWSDMTGATDTRNNLPSVWAVVLGWNHAEDTIECLNSIAASDGVDPHLLYVDNGSDEREVQKVLNGVPSAHVIRHPDNVGVPRGFNGGLAYALQHGADFVFMANNDTIVEPDSISILLRKALDDPHTGILVPKINYYNQRDMVWSAGSQYRRFPPSIVMRKTSNGNNVKLDVEKDLEFTTLCTVLIRGAALKQAGLMSPNFLYYYEDYDLAIRVRDAGYTLRMIPSSVTYHKVDRVTRESKMSASFWQTYGRSDAIFSRMHGRRHFWMCGAIHLLYLWMRVLFEGGRDGLKHFSTGRREGQRKELHPAPGWNDGKTDPTQIIRA